MTAIFSSLFLLPVGPRPQVGSNILPGIKNGDIAAPVINPPLTSQEKQLVAQIIDAMIKATNELFPDDVDAPGQKILNTAVKNGIVSGDRAKAIWTALFSGDTNLYAIIEKILMQRACLGDKKRPQVGSNILLEIKKELSRLNLNPPLTPQEKQLVAQIIDAMIKATNELFPDDVDAPGQKILNTAVKNGIVSGDRSKAIWTALFSGDTNLYAIIEKILMQRACPTVTTISPPTNDKGPKTLRQRVGDFLYQQKGENNVPVTAAVSGGGSNYPWKDLAVSQRPAAESAPHLGVKVQLGSKDNPLSMRSLAEVVAGRPINPDKKFDVLANLNIGYRQNFHVDSRENQKDSYGVDFGAGVRARFNLAKEGKFFIDPLYANVDVQKTEYQFPNIYYYNGRTVTGTVGGGVGTTFGTKWAKLTLSGEYRHGVIDYAPEVFGFPFSAKKQSFDVVSQLIMNLDKKYEGKKGAPQVIAQLSGSPVGRIYVPGSGLPNAYEGTSAVAARVTTRFNNLPLKPSLDIFFSRYSQGIRSTDLVGVALGVRDENAGNFELGYAHETNAALFYRNQDNQRFDRNGGWFGWTLPWFRKSFTAKASLDQLGGKLIATGSGAVDFVPIFFPPTKQPKKAPDTVTKGRPPALKVETDESKKMSELFAYLQEKCNEIAPSPKDCYKEIKSFVTEATTKANIEEMVTIREARIMKVAAEKQPKPSPAPAPAAPEKPVKTAPPVQPVKPASPPAAKRPGTGKLDADDK